MKRFVPLVALTACALLPFAGSAAEKGKGENVLDTLLKEAHFDFKYSDLTIAQLTAEASHGNAQRQFELGMRYMSGRDVPQSYQDAIRWFKTAADQRCTPALIQLGKCYENGWGVTKDAKKAVANYRKAANLGDANGQVALGQCFLKGIGLKKNPKQAVLWFHKAANQGSMQGQTMLAGCYESGTGVPQNYQKAMAWYTLAANRFDDDPKNKERSVKARWKKENEQDSGADGKEKNEKELREWWFKWRNTIYDLGVANRGYLPAQNRLGELYSEGTVTKPNLPEAAFWFFAAAIRGNAPAQNRLGECFRDGTGVLEKKQVALLWFRLAAEKGNKEAQANLQDLESKIADEKRKAAEEAAKKKKAAESGAAAE